jgi:epoxyqueuosine reductase
MVLDRAAVLQKAHELGFHVAGIAPVADPPEPSEQSARAHLTTWLNQGYQAAMDWMGNPKRQDIRRVMPGVQSVISVGLNYYTSHPHSDQPDRGKISRYGWGRDYHRVLQRRLKALATWLQTTAIAQGEPIQVRYYVDTGPLQDKVWAQRGGHRVDCQKWQFNYPPIWFLGLFGGAADHPQITA